MPIITDESRYPLVLNTFVGAPVAEDVASFIVTVDKLLDRKKPFVIIHDMRQGKSPAISVINQFADMSKVNAERDRLYALGWAFIVDQAVLRVGLKAYFGMARLASPTLVTNSPDEAETWALGKLRGKGLYVPEAV